jgi:DNA primase
MAGTLSKSVLETIRFRNDIADVIGSYFNLQKAGANFKALCPFHKEKTPSFHVNTQRQIYHCFGCEAGGDVFKFVMQYEGVDFMTAVRLLAERAGVRLEFDAGDRSAAEKDALYALHEEVASLYHEVLLRSPEAGVARAYLAKRRLPPPIIEAFTLGYAPNQWEFLVGWAQRKGYAPALMETAGFVLRRERGETGRTHYDRFRHRIMFPIRNEQGRVIAFSGRALETDERTAKYVNSPETPLFRKSRTLYALDKARHAIVERREALVCEGQIDVIRCHEAGFTAAVAAQGTAFTEDHARTLKRYADSVVVIFDPDEAGQRAAIRAAGVFLRSGLAVRVASLPPGRDPDAFILAQGADAFRAILDSAEPEVDFQIRVLSRSEAVDTEAGRLRVARAVLATIAESPSPVQRSLLLQRAAQRLNLAPAALDTELEALGRRPVAPAAPEPPAQAPRRAEPCELALAEHLLAHPDLASLVESHLPAAMVRDPLCRGLVEAVLAAAREGADLMAVIAARDNPARDLSSLAARLTREPSKTTGRESSPSDALRDVILRIWREHLEARRQALKAGGGEESADQRGMERLQITHDLSLLRRWETGEPIIKAHMQAPAPP